MEECGGMCQKPSSQPVTLWHGSACREFPSDPLLYIYAQDTVLITDVRTSNIHAPVRTTLGTGFIMGKGGVKSGSGVINSNDIC